MLEAISPGFPLIQCCEYNEELQYPYVSIDDYESAFNAVSYLSLIGKKRIAFFNSSTRYQYGKNRERGYIDALEKHGLTVDKNLIYHLNILNANVAYSAALNLFSLEDRPDAIFAVSDIYAIGAVRAAKKLNLNMPKDVAIIGFDNIEASTIIDPPLSTVNQPQYEISCSACSTLLGIIRENPPLSKGLKLKCELVVRNTT